MFFARSSLAVDIGRSSIKVVELSGDTRRRLKSIGIATLPNGAVADGMVRNVPQVENVLGNLLSDLGIRAGGRYAALGLSGSSLILRRAGFAPTSEEADMHEQIYYEAEQHFQHDMDELYFDYARISDRTDENGLVPYLLVGAKREMVDGHLAVVRSVGMRTGIIEPQSVSLLNTLESSVGPTQGLVGVADIGANVCQVSLSYGGEYLYSRDIALGGEQYTQHLMASLSIDRAGAETLKLAATEGDGSATDAVRKAVDDVTGQLVSEIQMTVDYFIQSNEIGPRNTDLNQLSTLFISGGASRTFGLQDAVSSALGVPVVIVDPFENIELGSGKFNADRLDAQGHLFGVAIGLAMRSLTDSR